MARGSRERFQGSPSALATYVQLLPGTQVLLAPSNMNRDECIILADVKPIYLGYGATAVPSTSLPIATGVYYSEPYFTGPIYGVVAAGGSAGAFVIDVGGGETS